MAHGCAQTAVRMLPFWQGTQWLFSFALGPLGPAPQIAKLRAMSLRWGALCMR